MENNYCRHPVNGVPQFKHSTWNKHGLVTDGNYTLTNNYMEAMNSSWTPGIPKCATVWTVIRKFKDEEALARLNHAQALRPVEESQNRSRNKKQIIKMNSLSSMCGNVDQVA